MLKVIFIAVIICVIYFIAKNKTKKSDNTPQTNPTQTDMEHYEKLQLSRFCDIISESLDIMCKTTNTGTFFSRYDVTVKMLNKAISVESCIAGNNTKRPSEILQDFYNTKDELINEFLKRAFQKTIDDASSLKTEKGKQNRLTNFFSEIESYNNYLSSANLILLTELKKRANLCNPNT